MQVKAYLEITMKIDNDKRPAAARFIPITARLSLKKLRERLQKTF